MAGRFNFTSPFSAFSGGFREQLLERENERARLERERVVAEQLKLQQAQEARAAEAQKISNAAQRQSQERIARQEALAAVERAGAGGVLQGDEADTVRRLLPSMVSVEGGQMSLPAKTLPMTTAPMTGDMKAPIVEGQELAPTMVNETVKSKGTKKQQIMKTIQDNPDMSDRELMLKIIEASGDDNIPASAADMLSNEDKTIPIFRRTTSGDMERLTENGWESFKGNLPEKHRLINEPNEGGQQSDYTYAVNTGQGVKILNRAGKVVAEFDSRLGETAQREITNAITVGKLMDRVSKDFTPEKVGVIQGRLSNLDAKYWGSDPEYAELVGSVRTLQNTVIQLRTGAQMSVQEAQRILDELPDEKTPPSTFVAKLNRARDTYNEWLKTRTAIGYGRTSADDVTRLTKEGFGAASPMPTDTAKGTKPSAKELIEKYRPGAK